MKYVESGTFTTKQMSILEIITEISDVIDIAKDIIQKDEDSKDLALNNLNQAINYLEYIKEKTNIALEYVPTEVQEKECL